MPSDFTIDTEDVVQSSVRAKLTAYNPTAYPASTLNSMSRNDMVYAAQLHNLNFEVAPGGQDIISVTDYGAVGDGVTDDTTAINNAITAVSSSGGIVLFPVGTFKITSQINLQSKTNITIKGSGGLSAGVATSTIITSNQASGSVINLKSTTSCSLSDIQVFFTNSSFNGSIIDLSSVGTDSAFFKISRCYIGGSGVATPLNIGINLDKAIIGVISECNIAQNDKGISGQAASSYSNIITVMNCQFVTSVSAHIAEIGEAWNILGNNFEGGLNAAFPGSIINTSTRPSEGCLISGNWFGDATGAFAGSQISLGGSFSVIGNYIGGASGSKGVNIQNDSVGVVVQGNRFDTASIAINSGSGTGEVALAPNSYLSVTNAYGGSLTSGIYFSHATVNPMAILSNTSSSSGNSVVRLTAARTSTKSYDVGIDSLGGNTKAFEVYDVTESKTRLRIPTLGGLVVGDAALLTTATDGFVYVPSCAGTPTGVPTAITGTAPIVIDSTNNKLYFYSGGAWRDAGP